MEQIVHANGIDLCYETFGSPTDPAVLWIMGQGAQGVFGEAGPLGEPFLNAGRYLIRYDARDVGTSTVVDFATNPYTISDMAADAIGLLDALGIEAAHLVGGSMGGMVAQEVAIDHPQRVLTLTSMMSTPSALDPTNPTAWTGGLPPMQPKVIEFFVEAMSTPPTTRDARIEAAVKMGRILAGTLSPFDEERARTEQERQWGRATNMDAAGNHSQAITRSRDRAELLAAVNVPTLVIHGTEDPIIPYEHGVATAKAIPGAKLLTIEGMGHEMPDAAIPRLVEAILRHIA